MKRLTFLTCHHKAPLVEAALAGCDFSVETLDSLDTDRFGTFSREVERRSSAHETALAKARLAANHAGSRYGLGSEGSFGRDPYLGMLAWNSELLCWWDHESAMRCMPARVPATPTTRTARWTAWKKGRPSPAPPASPSTD